MSNELKPRVKLTKTLPSGEGSYYWDEFGSREPRIVSVERCPVNASLFAHKAGGDYEAVSNMGGYWAKVEQDQFEFEG